jgi:hypothetical protein
VEDVEVFAYGDLGGMELFGQLHDQHPAIPAQQLKDRSLPLFV